MCGLCGVVEFGKPADVECVLRMRETLRHRGPDGTGLFEDEGVALGHTRLAIIDLSDNGLQPFASEDGTVQLLHNGEIYNYRELRAELEGYGHRFRTATDTEVLLAAYRTWGDACVTRFNGMWAFTIWDGRRRRLFCSRDRFGVKPLYYKYEQGRFRFASELKAFGSEAARPNPPAIRSFLEQGYVNHTHETMFDGVFTLPPAHSLVLDERGLRLSRYWRLESGHTPPQSAAEAVRETFLDSIRLRLRSDVPVGTALSGGLDSSAVACAVSHLLRTEHESAEAVGARQRTFTAYFDDPGFDERPFAHAIVDQAKAEPHWVSFTSDDLLADLPLIVESQDEPFGSTSIAAQWYVMREARRAGVRVMLDGQGGDEVFAGYPVYWGTRLADLLASGRVRSFAHEAAAYRGMSGARFAAVAAQVARPFIPESLKLRLRGTVTGASALLGSALREVPPLTDGELAHGDRLHRMLRRILLCEGLPELLRYEDRNSMAHSIEARVPFLDYRLVELGFSLPGHELLSDGMTKVVLRQALADLIPPVVRDRRDKLGFVTPEARFFRESLGAFAQEVFASRRCAERGLVDTRAALERLGQHRRGELDAGFELWRALSVELWARRFLDAQSERRPTR